MPTTRALPYVWALGLSGLLAGCEPPVPEVEFARPFPANAPDLREFPADCQGQYAATADAALCLSVGSQVLVRRRACRLTITAHQFDSLGLPPRAAQAWGPGGAHYQLQAVGADSVQLRWEERDTLAALGPRAKLRRYRGWYYLSTAGAADSAAWTVQRLAVANRQFSLQSFNPDTLRIRALDAATVQLRRGHGHRLFILSPRSGRATRQVSGYAGLWLPAGEYQRQVPGGKKPATAL